MRTKFRANQVVVQKITATNVFQHLCVLALASSLSLMSSGFQNVLAEEQTDALHNLVSAHYRCNLHFDLKHLSDDEAKLCAALYVRLKLQFVDGVDFKEYQQLSDGEKSAASKRGYLRFKAWERANPIITKQIEDQAVRSIGQQ